jgi:cell division protease FtsH
MVCEWGMSDKLGPMAYGAKEEELFLGREVTKTRNFSENTAIAIDAEVRLIVTRAMKRADKILKENVKILHRLANALLEREILDSEEIDKIIRGEELPPVDKHVNGTPSSLIELPEVKQARAKANVPTPPVISDEKKS